MYLPVTVYNPSFGNCSNNGVTVTHQDKLVVPCPDGHVTQADVDDHGYVVLDIEHKAPGYTSFKPRGDKRWLMMGGAFVYSSDSRFGRHYSRHPIPVHDRYEG